ncbi:MAG: carbohydrate kinase family protein [Spirochaetales bacterium]|nr:carbohydrate kinase family protein [Spirochaetales bacterium]
METRSALTIGPVFCDILLEGFTGLPMPGEERFLDSYLLSAGGNAIIAIALAQLGVSSSLLATVGSDSLGTALYALLAEHQVNSDHILTVDGAKTNLSLIINGADDRSFLTCAQERVQYEPVLAQRLASLSPSAYSHIHASFDSLGLEAVQTFLAQAQKEGVPISTGLGFQESLAWGPRQTELLKHVDWCFMNRSEAIRITGEEELGSIMHALRSFLDTPVITLGSEGSCALVDGRKMIRVSAPEVTVVNTTGSGDSFTAGFIYGRMMGKGIEECLAWGNVLGSLTASCKESVSSEISVAALDRWGGRDD